MNSRQVGNALEITLTGIWILRGLTLISATAPLIDHDYQHTARVSLRIAPAGPVARVGGPRRHQIVTSHRGGLLALLAESFSLPRICPGCANSITTPDRTPLPTAMGFQEVSLAGRCRAPRQEFRIISSEQGRQVLCNHRHCVLHEQGDGMFGRPKETSVRNEVQE